MKILVTGGAGKLGQWVVRELKAQQHDVAVFDRQTSGEPANREIIGDIEDLEAVTAAAMGVEAIIHLAGIPTHSVMPDNDTFRINAMGAFNIHEAARRNGVPRVVSLSSEAVLGWAPKVPVDYGLARTAASQDAVAVGLDRITAARDLLAEAEAAYVRYWHADQAVAVLDRRIALLRQVEEIAGVRYALGRAAQQDAIRAQVEQTSEDKLKALAEPVFK